MRPAARTTPTARDGNRNKLSSVSPYQRGKSDAPASDIVMQRRPKFMENKCLVMQGLRKGISHNQCIDYIKKTAGRDVNVLHLEILSREYSPWMTVAIELNEEDYDVLSNINIWENSIGIRDYVGWRHWHGPRPRRLSADEIKRSVRMSWSTDGGPS